MSRLRTIVASLAVLSGLAGLVSAADEPLRDIAPTGALRVAVAVGPAASTFWATRDASGQARGVTVELAKAAAAKLHVPLRLVEYHNALDRGTVPQSCLGEITVNAV